MSERQKLYDRINALHEEDDHVRIIEIITEIPEEKRDYELIGFLARAFNNIEEYQKALDLLNTTADEGKEDDRWHFRTGYAHYYLDNPEEAKACFNRVLELTPEDEDASLFLKWIEEEIEGVDEEDKTFKERVDEFWNWFTENEEKLSDYVSRREEYDAEEIIGFVSEGVGFISEDIHFNIGGDFELTFAVEGRTYLFYLLPYLTSRLPEQFRGKWKIFPYMQGTNGQSFGFKMYDKNLQLEDVKVSAVLNESGTSFDIRFYSDVLNGLEENEAYNVFYIMMEITIGEGLSKIYVNDAERVSGFEDGMFPLTELERKMKDAVSAAGKELMTRPDESYTGYGFEPEEKEELRFDVIAGASSFIDLIDEYYAGSEETLEQLRACGARAGFIAFPYGENEDRGEMLNLRYEMEDRLQNEVFGKRGSGEETAIVLGGATGTGSVYIDLLLYDGFKPFDKVEKFLAEYPYDFYLSEFRRESGLIKLTGD